MTDKEKLKAVVEILCRDICQSRGCTLGDLNERLVGMSDETVDAVFRDTVDGLAFLIMECEG